MNCLKTPIGHERQPRTERLYGILGVPMILYGGHLIMGARKVQARPGLFDSVRAVAVLVGW